MGAGVVGAGDDRSAPGLDAVAELDEGFAHLLRGSVVIEVVGFDVREDADGRFVEEERSVGFVCFGDEDVSGAQMGVRARRRQHSPMTKDGSTPQACSATVVIDVVVVFP